MSEPYLRPLPYASHAASSILSLLDAQGLRQASISSTTDSSFVPNHKSPGMVGRSAGRIGRWKLDRLGRSLRELIDLVGRLEGRGVG